MNIETLIEKLAATGTGKEKLVKVREIHANATVQAFNDVFIDEIRNKINAVTAVKAQTILAESAEEEAAKAKADAEANAKKKAEEEAAKAKK